MTDTRYPKKEMGIWCWHAGGKLSDHSCDAVAENG
mgnify:FL=1